MFAIVLSTFAQAFGIALKHAARLCQALLVWRVQWKNHIRRTTATLLVPAGASGLSKLSVTGSSGTSEREPAVAVMSLVPA